MAGRWWSKTQGFTLWLPVPSSISSTVIFKYLHPSKTKKKSVTEDFDFNNYLADKGLRMAPAVTCLLAHLAIFCDSHKFSGLPFLKNGNL